jgi:hypothetical protein
MPVMERFIPRSCGEISAHEYTQFSDREQIKKVGLLTRPFLFLMKDYIPFTLADLSYNHETTIHARMVTANR